MEFPRLRYKISGSLSEVRLASGGAHSAHAAFVNSWNQPALAQLVRQCLNAGRVCNSSISGCAEALSSAGRVSDRQDKDRGQPVGPGCPRYLQTLSREIGSPDSHRRGGRKASWWSLCREGNSLRATLHRMSVLRQARSRFRIFKTLPYIVYKLDRDALLP